MVSRQAVDSPPAAQRFHYTGSTGVPGIASSHRRGTRRVWTFCPPTQRPSKVPARRAPDRFGGRIAAGGEVPVHRAERQCSHAVPSRYIGSSHRRAQRSGRRLGSVGVVSARGGRHERRGRPVHCGSWGTEGGNKGSTMQAELNAQVPPGSGQATRPGVIS